MRHHPEIKIKNTTRMHIYMSYYLDFDGTACAWPGVNEQIEAFL